MKRWLALFLVVPLLAACTQQTVVYKSTLASQFEEFNKQGWSVARNDQPKSVRPVDDPNVRVIRDGFGKMEFNTNFKVDDPKFPDAAYTGRSTFNGMTPEGQPAAGPTGNAAGAAVPGRGP